MKPREAALECVKQINTYPQPAVNVQVGIALVLALVAIADAIEAAK